MTKTIKLGPVATGLILVTTLFGGWVLGVKTNAKYVEEKMIKRDVMNQFIDIIADALGDDGEVFL